MFTVKSDGNFQETDFQWISDWGFDFVRIPMCYTLWIEDDDPYAIHEPMLEKVDRMVAFGQKYGLHVNLSFHRAPGFSVNPERTEPYNLWKDEDAQQAFDFHWSLFAKRYKGLSNQELSINLVNEPKPPSEDMSREDHERVVRRVTGAIRSVDPDRLIIADGLSWGNDPCPELADLGIAQSCRAYVPATISHYRAGWVDTKSSFPYPQWPEDPSRTGAFNRERLEAHYAQWAELAKMGIGVHCGEGGAFSHTPHDVFLRWLEDVLDILTGYGIGYALWNFRGGFGVMDSDRQDVDYEDWHGHQLDRKLLNLLQKY
jgi:endoglucanase